MSELLFGQDGKPEFSYRKCETIEELSQYIKELVDYKHDYNTSGYAITKALLATEQLMAHLLGTTGSQHGYAQLAYMQETRGSKTGIACIDFDKLCYPQYDILGDVKEWIEEHKQSEVFKKYVQEKINEDNKSDFKAHPDVRKRWESLVSKV